MVNNTDLKRLLKRDSRYWPDIIGGAILSVIAGLCLGVLLNGGLLMALGNEESSRFQLAICISIATAFVASWSAYQTGAKRGFEYGLEGNHAEN
jgi:hypothetical protein